MISNEQLGAKFHPDIHLILGGQSHHKSTTFIPYITHLLILYEDCRLVIQAWAASFFITEASHQ